MLTLLHLFAKPPKHVRCDMMRSSVTCLLNFVNQFVYTHVSRVVQGHCCLILHLVVVIVVLSLPRLSNQSPDILHFVAVAGEDIIFVHEVSRTLQKMQSGPGRARELKHQKLHAFSH